GCALMFSFSSSTSPSDTSTLSLHDALPIYPWLLDTRPKEWTDRYAAFIRPNLMLNFVLLVSDGKTLHHDTLYHLGIGVAYLQSLDRKSTRLNSSHVKISYAVFCLKKKNPHI